MLDSSLFQWNLDSRFHSLVGYLSSILDSKALDSGFHKQDFPGFLILQAKIFQILESGYPYMGRSTSQTFSDLFTHYNVIDRRNVWSMQLFQTGPHFKLEEASPEKVFFRLDITDFNTNVRGSGKLTEDWKGIFYLLN